MSNLTLRWQLLSVLTIWSATAGLILVLHWTVNEFVIDVVNDWNSNIVEEISEHTNYLAVEQAAENFLERVNYFDDEDDENRSVNQFLELLSQIDPADEIHTQVIEHLQFFLGEAEEPDVVYFSSEVLVDIGEHYFWYADDELYERIEDRLNDWPDVEWLPGSLNATTLSLLADEALEDIEGIEDVCLLAYTHEDELIVSNLQSDSTQAKALGYDLHQITGDSFRQNSQTRQAVPLNCLANYIEGDDFYGFVGVESRELVSLFSTLQRIRNWGIPATFILSLIMGTWLAIRFRKPLVALNRTIDQIQTGDLSARVSEQHGTDELGQLTGKVNTMLETIERLVIETRHMADNIAHDLQTPLTRLQTRVQKIQQRDPTLESELDDISGEIERLQNFCRALLHLADVESEKVKSHFTEISLTDVVKSVSEMYKPILEDLGYEFELVLPKSDIQLLGDKTLLQQAVSNCLDNCTKYVPTGERISVTLRQTEAGCELSIKDTGPGVSPAQLKQLSQRFYRAERDRATPGNGLGLALVDSIVTAHNGSMTLASKGGFEVICRF